LLARRLAFNHSKPGGLAGKGRRVREIEPRTKAFAIRPTSHRSLLKADVRNGPRPIAPSDFLVLNAAKAPFKPFEKLLEREIRQLVETNFMGNIFCIQEAVRMLEATGGKIIFISSLGSRFYNPSYPLGSMKAAMEAVVRDCAESLAPRQSVNGVCGGV